jgi:uroporphyrinogen decarboxylase
MGIEPLLTDLHESPKIAQAVLQKVASYWTDFGVSLLEAADGTIDFFVINDDYGTQQGPLFNPAIWRTYIKPIIQKVIEAYKRFGVKIIFHSCGSVRLFIPDLIEMGIDVLDPVQVSAKDMVPRRLKEEFGSRLCFRGAVDTQRVLPRGSPNEVKEEVRTRIRELAPGGGYIATAVHNIQPDVPLQNIVAMYEAAREHGRYPIS